MGLESEIETDQFCKMNFCDGLRVVILKTNTLTWRFVYVTLQPDITAPGVNILAAWSEASSPTKLADDHRVVQYNIDSGTSMSCPHVGAAAALLKAIHPTWSSAAIRSALITSGTICATSFCF
ncbi:hypothetical protein U1Q18_010434 [Sarracenia purpurea var. burkii]